MAQCVVLRFAYCQRIGGHKRVYCCYDATWVPKVKEYVLTTLPLGNFKKIVLLRINCISIITLYQIMNKY